MSLGESFPAAERSKCMNELLLQKDRKLLEAEIEAQMREGYLATLGERKKLNHEWQIVDGEGWPE